MTSMESMPRLVILKIASFLQSRDLVACSAICKSWREKFNIDAVWKPHILFTEKYYKIQEKYKDMILCPPYYTALEPLCVAREYYIRDQCLRYNCKAGLFTTEEIKLKNPGKIRHLINNIDDEGNYWLFINTTEAIEVWNITNKPLFQSGVSKVLPNAIDSMYIIDTKVTLVFSEFVIVYTFEHPKNELIFQCCFHFDDESPTEDLPGLFESKKNKPFDRGNQNMKHFLSGSFLIGFTGQIPKSILPAACMHVWNMETLVKLYRTNVTNSPSFCQSVFDNEDVSEKIIQIDIFEGDPHHVIVVLQESEVENLSIMLYFNIQNRVFNLVKSFRRAKILWTCMVNGFALVFGFLLRSGFYFSLIDRSRGDISVKNASKLGLDLRSQVIFCHPVFVHTADTLFVVEAKDEKLTIKKVLEDQTCKGDTIGIVSSFMFSKTNQGPIKMWDLDCKCSIADLPEFSEKVDVSSIKSLKNVVFPPKILCPSNEKNSVYVLSFW